MVLFIQIWKFGQNLPLATFCSERINVLSGFYLSLGFNGHFVIPNLAEFRDTAPLRGDVYKIIYDIYKLQLD